MEKKTLRKADMVTSIVLMAIAVSWFGLSIPLLIKTVRSGEHFYISAGLFPMIISGLLGLCAANLFFKARKDGARFDFFKADKVIALIKSRESRIAAVIIGLMAVYIFILLPLVSYSIATFIFLFLFMLYFKGLRSVKGVLIIFIISAVTTAILSYGFGELAMIPLP